MAECDAGYYCRVCAEYVDGIVDSEIYLRYVLRDIPFAELAGMPEAHIWCNGNLAQYIVDPAFGKTVRVDDDQDKARQDPQTRALMEKVITLAWQRLQGLPDSGLDVTEYPMPDMVSPHEMGESQLGSEKEDAAPRS